jgi:hypothetical protein
MAKGHEDVMRWAGVEIARGVVTPFDVAEGAPSYVERRGSAGRWTW